MKILKRSVTVALLLFVGATVGLLIAQEVSDTDAESVAEVLDVGTDEEAVAGTSVETPGQSVPDDAMEAADAAVNGPVASDLEDASPEAAPAGAAETAEVAASEAESVCVVDAIYFHNTLRCRTCTNIEESARAVVEAEFAGQFTSGRLRWLAINMEKQRQYVERFDLVKPTLILVRSVGGEETAWVALDETWSLIRYESRFAEYVEDETRAFLEACP